MEVSEVKIKLMGERSDRLKAFCSVTLDKEFVIRDLKVIEGTNGIFVAMPSRKITDKCPACGAKNHLRSKYCNDCGMRLNENRAARDLDGRAKLHADIAHPINSGCRDKLQRNVVRAFEEEIEKSKQPGYRPAYDDEFDDLDYIADARSRARAERPQQRQQRFAAQEQTPQVDAQPKEPNGNSFAAGIF